jgi:hypothetical protein
LKRGDALCLSHIKSEHIYDGDRPEMDGRLRPAVSAARDVGASSFNDNAVQVTFAKHHDVTNAFPADRADQPFCVRIFAKVGGQRSGGLECRSTESGGQRSRHKLHHDLVSSSEGFAASRTCVCRKPKLGGW